MKVGTVGTAGGTGDESAAREGEMGIGADYMVDSTPSAGAFRWISASGQADRSVHRIHSPYHHHIHYFIFLFC
jgi:hypothetical protein